MNTQTHWERQHLFTLTLLITCQSNGSGRAKCEYFSLRFWPGTLLFNYSSCLEGMHHHTDPHTQPTATPANAKPAQIWSRQMKHCCVARVWLLFMLKCSSEQKVERASERRKKKKWGYCLEKMIEREWRSMNRHAWAQLNTDMVLHEQITTDLLRLTSSFPIQSHEAVMFWKGQAVLLLVDLREYRCVLLCVLRGYKCESKRVHFLILFNSHGPH